MMELGRIVPQSTQGRTDVEDDTRLILALLAQELLLGREQLDSLAETLCADPDIVHRHVAALQTLDSVGQSQAAIAQIIQAEDMSTAARTHSLEAIIRRLQGLSL